MPQPLLNIDAGEHDDEPEELYALAHVVNVACGGHAGDARSMRRVVDACKLHGTKIGAHPSYPDREGFGRKTIAMTDDALAASVGAQCEALADVARQAGAHVELAKLHGALYHDANRDLAVARACLRGVVRALGRDVTIIGPVSGAMAEACRELGLVHMAEGFADRGVREDGSLVPRGEPGALVTDPDRAAARAKELASTVGTICVHGDTKGAVAIARAVREVLGGKSAEAG